jgi:hypothetical protein
LNVIPFLQSISCPRTIVLFCRLARFVSFPGVPVFTTWPVVLLTSSMLSIILSPAATLALGLAFVFPNDVITLLLEIFSDPL